MDNNEAKAAQTRQTMQEISAMLQRMTKEEVLAYTHEAFQYCLRNNLYRKGTHVDELTELQKDPKKLMMASILKMEMHKKAHPEAQ